jgi:hypothetical protein
MLSSFAFNVNLRRYTSGGAGPGTHGGDDDDDPHGSLHAQVAAFARGAGPSAEAMRRRTHVHEQVHDAVTAGAYTRPRFGST